MVLSLLRTGLEVSLDSRLYAESWSAQPVHVYVCRVPTNKYVVRLTVWFLIIIMSLKYAVV